MKNSVRLYRHYISIVVRETMTYKVSFFMSVTGQFLVSFNVFLGIFFMFQRFSHVRGYSYEEVLLCFSIVLLEFSLAEMWARGFDMFAGIVRHGEFDRILLRPRSPILQVLGSRFELSRIGRMLQAAVVFVYGILKSDVDWNIWRVVTVAFMLFGGAALFSGLFMIYAALSFFTLEGLEFMNVFTDGGREYGKYPVNVYGKRMLQFCTFVVPYALVQYYPLLYLLGKTDNPACIVLPLFAALFLVPAWGLWRFGMKKYQSAGS